MFGGRGKWVESPAEPSRLPGRPHPAAPPRGPAAAIPTAVPSAQAASPIGAGGLRTAGDQWRTTPGCGDSPAGTVRAIDGPRPGLTAGDGGSPGGCVPAAGAQPASDPGGPEPPTEARLPEASAVEHELVHRARQGDVAAFERLLGPLMQPAYQLAVRLLGDRQLAEDVAQDAFTKAYLGMRHFRGDARFGTWIFRIVHNACTDALRHRARRPSVPAPFGLEPAEDESGPRDPADPAPGPEDVAVERVGRQAILDAVAGLPADHRAVVLLREVQGLSYEEISAVTRQNVGTVKSRLHRARAALRAALDGPPPGAEHLRPDGVKMAEARREGGPGAGRERGVR